MGRFSTVRDLLHRLVSDSPSVTRTIAHGRKELLRGEGGNSLFAWPFLAGARKAIGKERVNEGLYEHFHRPLKNLDEKGGKLLADTLGAPKLFRQVDVLPTGRTIGGNRVSIEHATHSATAPIGKASKVVTPIAASMYASELLDRKRDPDEEKMATAAEPQVDEREALLKEAAAALTLQHKRHEAEKLAFQMVEKGSIPQFRSFDEFDDKVATIMSKDVAVVREALELDPQLPDFGKVASDQQAGTGSDPVSAFYHRLAE